MVNEEKGKGYGERDGKWSQQASLTVLTGIKISKNHFKKYYYPPSHHVNINVMKLLINVTTRSILKTHTNIQFTVIMFFRKKSRESTSQNHNASAVHKIDDNKIKHKTIINK